MFLMILTIVLMVFLTNVGSNIALGNLMIAVISPFIVSSGANPMFFGCALIYACNIGIFLPVGVFSALLWRKPRWWKSLAVGLGASTAFESIQYFIGRSADVDDVLLNTAGALLGFWLFWLARALCPRLIAGFQCHECHERGDDNGLSHGN